MNSNNVRTSVVIEVANQEEPNDEKMYKIDFDDIEPPKGYMIDQIYCGEDVTVYALFEVSELTNGDLEKQLVEVTSSSASENLKFYNRNSCHKAINDWTRNDKGILPASKKQSFYCLQNLGPGYEKPSLEESKDMKVLYSKDMTPKSTRFKSVSIGVNTDIAQSPRLLEEVQRAVSFNLSQSKTEKNLMEVTSLSSWKLREDDIEQSLTSIRSEVGGKKCNKKSSPNVLLVPLIMMEDGMLSQLKIEKNATLEDTPRKKVSQGVNTECLMTLGTKGDLENTKLSENKSNEYCNEERTTNSENYLKSHPHTLSKDSILEEIKKLQLKLNCLIQSLEHSTTKMKNPDETTATDQTSAFNQDLKQFEAPFEVTLNEKSEDSSLVPSSYSLNQSGEYRVQNHRNIEEAISLTNFVGSVTRNVSSTTHKAYGSISSQVDLKTEPEEFINWGIVLSRKVPATSKSEFRCLDQKSAIGIKRSLSLNLKEVKPDVMGLKKLKNTFFKLEGSVKSKESTRLHLPEENLLSEKFPLLKCEMGDEAQEKLQCSNLNLKPVLNKPEVLKSVCKNIKLKNEEEGDAKVLNTSSTVHYYSANISPSKLKEEKSLLKGDFADKSIEKGIRTNETGKSKRTSFQDASTKKEVRINTKSNSRSKIENQVKPLSETSDEMKQKSTPGARKSKNLIEPKHIEKGQKKTTECSKTKVSQQSKIWGKEDTSKSRPPSQKRRDSTANCADVKEKSGNPRKGHLGQVMVFERKVDKDTASSKKDSELVSSNPSSVIVELFSKKPTSVDEIDSGLDQKCTEDSSGGKEENGFDKPVAKSVWALTKVLLYEDGTKKFEVLEASLTPPDYSLQNGKRQDVRN